MTSPPKVVDITNSDVEEISTPPTPPAPPPAPMWKGYVQEKLFTREEIKSLLTMIKSKEFVSAKIGTGKAVQDSYRISETCGLSKRDVDYRWVYNRIHRWVSRENKKYWDFNIAETPSSLLVEQIQLAIYNGTGDVKGHYGWHHDIGHRGQTASRRLSVTVQLTNQRDYRGGELEMYFTLGPQNVTKQQGIAILFPSFIPHRVRPVLKGIRYSLVCWFRKGNRQ